MIEEIKKELLNCDVEILYGKFGEEYKYLKHSDVAKLLDKYNNQPKEMIHIGSRIGKSLQQAQNIAKYINDNKLTECNINVVEVPNDYKNAWEELKERMNDDRFCPCFMDMQELEQKYGIKED
jgi:glutamate formiminotransferase